MIKKVFCLTLFLLLLASSTAFAKINLSDIETAVIEENFAKVQTLAKQLLDQNPDQATNLEANYYLGLSHLRMGENITARVIFQKLINENLVSGTRDKVYLGIFDSHYLEGEYAEALKVAQRLLKESPDSEFLSLVHLKIARANLKLTNWRKAKNHLKIVTDRFPESFENHTARQLLEEKQYFAVQVGSFLDRKRAEKLVEELRQKNEYAYIVETKDRGSTTFFRVRVGQMALLNDAEGLQTKLASQGYPTQIYP